MLLHAITKLETIKGETASPRLLLELTSDLVMQTSFFFFLMEFSIQIFPLSSILAKSLAQLADNKAFL